MLHPTPAGFRSRCVSTRVPTAQGPPPIKETPLCLSGEGLVQRFMEAPPPHSTWLNPALFQLIMLSRCGGHQIIKIGYQMLRGRLNYQLFRPNGLHGLQNLFTHFCSAAPHIFLVGAGSDQQAWLLSSNHLSDVTLDGRFIDVGGPQIWNRYSITNTDPTGFHSALKPFFRESYPLY